MNSTEAIFLVVTTETSTDLFIEPLLKEDHFGSLRDCISKKRYSIYFVL